MEIFSEYAVAIVVAICLGIGYIIKSSLDFIPNKFIPLIMGVIGIFLNVWLQGWAITPQILLQGLSSGLASTGAFEMVRNLANSDKTGGSKDASRQ